MKTYKIFLASSSELVEDREKFRTFISRKNDKWHRQHIYLEIIQWEFFLDNISKSRLQDEYNNALKNCDIAICLFFSKVGKYTEEEFDTAYHSFKNLGTPKIWTYFKNAPINSQSITREIESLLKFKEKLHDIGHFYSSYTNVDNLLLNFTDQFETLLSGTLPVSNLRENSTLDEQVVPIPPQDRKGILLNLIDLDLEKAFVQLDQLFLNKSGTYNDLSKEFMAQPNNFSLSNFKSKLKRFVTHNIN